MKQGNLALSEQVFNPTFYDVTDAILQKIQEERSGYAMNPNGIWPSVIGWVLDCKRHVWHRCYSWEKARPISPTLQLRFDVGTNLEGLVRTYLSKLEYGNPRLEISWHPPKDRLESLRVNYKLDFLVRVVDSLAGITSPWYPGEIKTVAASYFSQLKTPRDIKDHRFSFVRHWYSQTQTYSEAKETFWSLMILVPLPPTGDKFIRHIWMPRDNEHMGLLYAAMEEVREQLKREDTAPEPEPGEYCDFCGFKGTACPVIQHGDSQLEIVSDEELAEAARIYTENKEAAGEYERAKKIIKEKSRGRKNMIIPGGFLLKGKWSPHTSYDIPESIKGPFKKVNQEGRWNWKIIQVPGK